MQVTRSTIRNEEECLRTFENKTEDSNGKGNDANNMKRDRQKETGLPIC